jgi:O-antigen/teichoic acid export membrane protein
VRDIVHIGGWGVGGAAIYWAATQGYSYIVAGSLGVAAVAALAGTRLIMMPVNLLSTGIVSIVAPTSSEWLRTRGPMICFKRLSLVALGMACIALCYIPFMWVLRNWIFGTVLHKVFPSRDNLILFWGAIFTVSCLRDQLGLYLMMRGRTRTLTLIAACSAAVSLSATLAAMQLFGLPGALAGLLLGEITNASCTLWISWLDARKSQAEYASVAAAAPGLSPG